MNAEAQMRAARTGLVLEQPFFGVLALRLALKPDPSPDTTMWTDGRTIGYSPEWVEKQTHDALVATIAHEVMHCAAGHPWRRDGRDQEKWNDACDRAINPMLRDCGFKLPADALGDAGDNGRSAEWIYSRMPGDKPGDQPGGQGQGGGGKQDAPPQPQQGKAPGEVRDAPQDAAEDGTTESEWQAAAQQAAKAAQAMGKMPGGAKRFVTESVKPRVDWRAVLRRFVQEASNADYTWRTPNRRYIPSGLFLPSLRSEELGPILFAIDTSGSIDATALAAYWGEVVEVVGEMNPRAAHVVYCDSKVQQHDTFERGDAMELRSKGGGGTRFEPVFELAGTLDEPPVCIVYLTDLDGSFPESSDIPTLWVSNATRAVPFGEFVLMED